VDANLLAFFVKYVAVVARKLTSWHATQKLTSWHATQKADILARASIKLTSWHARISRLARLHPQASWQWAWERKRVWGHPPSRGAIIATSLISRMVTPLLSEVCTRFNAASCRSLATAAFGFTRPNRADANALAQTEVRVHSLKSEELGSLAHPNYPGSLAQSEGQMMTMMVEIDCPPLSTRATTTTTFFARNSSVAILLI
jgi:hypothetical protein